MLEPFFFLEEDSIQLHNNKQESKANEPLHSKMRYMSITPLLAFALISVSSAQETCPEIPANDVQIGEPVPIVPGDIPKGCSAFEILVGKLTTQCLPLTYPPFDTEAEN